KNSLEVQFSEEINSTIAENTVNYSADNGIGNPNNVVFDLVNRDRLTLEFNNSFSDGIQNTIDIINIEDLEANVIRDTSVYFTYEYQKPISCKVLDTKTISLSFLRAVDTVSAEEVSNYLVNNSVGNPVLASVIDENKVKLEFASDFVNEINYEIEVSNIADINGDAMPISSTLEFLFFISQENDIVINEIFADPSPQVALPESEYIELFNTTAFNINISGWIFSDGLHDCEISEQSIEANSYMVLCDIDDIDNFSEYNNVIGVSSFPGLNNDGETLQLLDTNNTVISEVSYTDEWYQDNDKDDGGWSIEKIDPENNCSGINNWKASEDEKGGTPGTINSVDAENIDNTKPSISFIELLSTKRIKIHLSESINETIATTVTNYTVDNGIGNPQYVIVDNSVNQIELVFGDEFLENITNILSVNNLADNCGNIMDNKDLEFVYHPIEAYDIVINEIMPDPEPAINLPESEYIELYNTSNYDISISNWILEVGGSDVTINPYVIHSGEYLILCDDDADEMLNIYGKTLAFSSFPSLSNSGTRITLKTDLGKLISNINYTDKWYSDNNKEDGGWSIEQVDPSNPCGGINNWKASEDEKGGTPGEENSVFASNPDLYAPELLKATMKNDSVVKLFFSEAVDSLFATMVNSYEVEDIGN
ncbi:MAG: lamin tail domain-containing protein, partial [Bacteroidota bacterium]|nr:lamin tail domain-containing protein [Bacteroidota bacterium]